MSIEAEAGDTFVLFCSEDGAENQSMGSGVDVADITVTGWNNQSGMSGDGLLDGVDINLSIGSLIVMKASAAAVGAAGLDTNLSTISDNKQSKSKGLLNKGRSAD